MTLNGPQGHVSAKTVASVEMIEWGLQRLLCKKKGRRCNSVQNEVPMMEMASFREPGYLQCKYPP